MTNMCTAAANFIIEEVNRDNEGKPIQERVFMSSKRLQKLLYFSDVLYMYEHHGESMFKDDFYAWPSGPVIPSVYRKFMQYQDGQMRPYSGVTHDEINPEMQKTIRRVLTDTKKIDTNILIDESHLEDAPWHAVYDENDEDYSHKVGKKEIFAYYSKHGVPYGGSGKIHV